MVMRCRHRVLKIDYTITSLENLIVGGIFAISASVKKDVNKFFDKFQLDGLFKTDCSVGRAYENKMPKELIQQPKKNYIR
jgi:hypothetical protein